jgi:hypothetical protein
MCPHDDLSQIIGILICQTLDTVLLLIEQKERCGQPCVDEMQFQLIVLLLLNFEADPDIVQEGQQRLLQLLGVPDSNTVMAISFINSIGCDD